MTDKATEFAATAITNDKLVPWPRVAAVAAMVSFSLPTFITGLEVSQGMTTLDAFHALFWGSVIITVIGTVMGVIGSKTRMNSYLLVRIAFGDKGAGVVNVAFALSLLGWFGVNINLFTDALSRLGEEAWGIYLPSVGLAVLASLCMTVTTLVGFKAINILASLMVPVLAFVTFLLIQSALSTHSLEQIMALEKIATLSVGDGISAIVGAIIVGAIILPDITRFVGHWRGAVYTALIAYLGVQFIVMIAASLAGAVSGSTDILDIMLSLNLGVGAFILVIAGSWVLNSLNLYSTILSIKATFPDWNSTVLAIGLGVVGVAAALLNILDSFVTFLFYLSVVFIPVAGVIVIDYAFIRHDAYRLETLGTNKNFNMMGLIAWAVGAVLAVLASQERIPTITNIAAMDAVIISGIIYTVLTWLHRVTRKVVTPCE